MSFSELLEPRRTGPFRTVAVLGEGGMGRVLLGVSPDGRLVAVKQVHADLADDDGFRARFRREVAVSRRVSGAYTAPVLDADADAPVPWPASAFVPGPSLSQALEAVRALPVPSVRQLAAGLAQALADIHRAGLIHRGLKPSNVLLAEDGVRVIDFGIARVVDGAGGTALTQTDLVIGSPPFMSPEQAEGREPTASGDVFSLGSVLIFAATGSSPFAGASTARSLYNVVHTQPDLTAVPAELRRIIEPCLAKDPAARPTPAQLQEFVGPVAHSVRPWPSDVHRMLEEQRASIDRLLNGHERTVVSAPPPPNTLASAPTRTAVRSAPPAPPSGRPRTKVLAALVAAGVLALAGVGVGVYALTSGGGEPSDRRDGSSSGAAGDGASPAADPGDGGDPSQGAEARPDTYTKVPLCSEAAKNLPLRGRDEASDRYQESGDRASTACWWYGSYEEGGVRHRDGSPHAFVEWDLKRSSSSSSDPTDNGTFFQRQIFDTRAKEGGPEPALGFGDAAYWRDLDNPTEDPETNCSLKSSTATSRCGWTSAATNTLRHAARRTPGRSPRPRSPPRPDNGRGHRLGGVAPRRGRLGERHPADAMPPVGPRGCPGRRRPGGGRRPPGAPAGGADRRQPRRDGGGGRVLLRPLVGTGHRARRLRAAQGRRGGVPHRQAAPARTPRRPAGDRRITPPDGGYRPSRGGLRRAAALEQWAALGLTTLALPVLTFVAALDGQAWASIVRCQVTDGTRTESNRLIELGRKGNGVVGWNLDTEEISNGAGCTGEESLYVREPWWRD